MKKVFIAFAALATLAACNKAEVIGVPEGEEIAFNEVFVDNTTKAATDPSYSANGKKLTAFNVWGSVNGGAGVVSIFNNNTVTGTIGSEIVNPVETHVWTCEKKQYWINGATYNFAALVNAGDVTLGDADDDTDNLLPISVDFTADGATDLLYAKSTENIVGTLTNNAPVNFTFAHLLSKVKFTVKNNSTTATGYSFDVRDITITCPKTGTVILAPKTDATNPSDKNWESLGTPAAYSVPTVTVNNSTASEECASELLLIPGSVSVNYAVDIKCDGTTVATHTPAAAYTTTLVGGNSYNFVVNVAVGEEITFSVDQNPSWTNSITIQ